jgi:hypothetical protein
VELYKHCKSAHHDSLLSSGSLRVGTLKDYRRTEIYGELVGDENEGKKTIGGIISELTSESAHQYPGIEALRQARLINIDMSGGGSITNLTIKNAVSESHNLLVFSAAAEYSREAHVQWLKAEGYDACYKITSARLFFRAISRAIAAQHRFLGFAAVVYEDSFALTDHRSHTHPALVKRRSAFSGQSEVRGLWAAQNSADLEPVVLESSAANIYAMPFAKLPAVEA